MTDDNEFNRNIDRKVAILNVVISEIKEDIKEIKERISTIEKKCNSVNNSKVDISELKAEVSNVKRELSEHLSWHQTIEKVKYDTSEKFKTALIIAIIVAIIDLLIKIAFRF